MKPHLLALAAALAMFGCGSDTPTTPTPQQPTRQLQFFSDNSGGEQNSFWLTGPLAAASQVTIRLAGKFPAACPISKFRGTIIYDDAVAAFVSTGNGDFLQSGGAVVQTIVTRGSNYVNFTIDRPDSLAEVSGSGTLATLTLSRVNSAATGARSPIQWDDAHAYTRSFIECLNASYNGELVVTQTGP